ncbi:MAG: alpha/beta fold hydrolase [bacterium]
MQEKYLFHRRVRQFLLALGLIVFLGGHSSVAIAQQDNQYVAKAKVFFDAMEHEKFHEAYQLLDSSVQRVVSEEQSKGGWKHIRSKFGAFRTIMKSRTEELKPYIGVYLTLRYDSALIDLKVVFKDKAAIVGFFFVPPLQYTMPPYADTSKMTQRRVEVKTGDFTLGGLLTLPREGSNFPVVVMVHGSGPHDRDETIKDNKPFADLAYGLATMGIASIRYDKRTFIYGAKSSSTPATITLQSETVDDAVSALKLAQKIKEIDPKQIYLLGHSQGALCAPRIAKATPFIAGIIMLAGNARAFEDVIADQMAFLLPQQLPKKQADSVMEVVNKQIARVKKGPISDENGKLPLGLPAGYWKDLKSYDQVAVAKSLPMKMLFLQGEKDYQVTMTDFNLWKKSLASKSNASFISYPGFFHLFFKGEGKPSDYDKDGHVDKKVIDDISSWIKK